MPAALIFVISSVYHWASFWVSHRLLPHVLFREFIDNVLFVTHTKNKSHFLSEIERWIKNFTVPLKTPRIFKIYNENIHAGTFQISTWPGQSIWYACWRLWHYSYVSSTDFLFFCLHHFSSSIYHHLDFLIVVIDIWLLFLLLRLLGQF